MSSQGAVLNDSLSIYIDNEYDITTFKKRHFTVKILEGRHGAHEGQHDTQEGQHGAHEG